MSETATHYLWNQKDYRAVLRGELERRQSRNLRYSLRAFARDLQIGPNRLSEILNGKQGLSSSYAKQIAGNLGYTKVETDYFCEMVRCKHARSTAERKRASLRISELNQRINYHQISTNIFRIISEWHHLAILELAKLKSFKPKSEWIASRLGISKQEVKESLNRLETTGFIKRAGAKIELTLENNRIPETLPSECIKKFHEGILKRANASLWTQPLQMREFSSTLLAIDPTVLPQIKMKVEKFWKEIDRDFGGKGNPSQVYGLGVQCFALTEGEDAAHL